MDSETSLRETADRDLRVRSVFAAVLAVPLALLVLSCAETSGSAWIRSSGMSEDELQAVPKPERKGNAATKDMRTRTIRSQGDSPVDFHFGSEADSLREQVSSQASGRSVGVFRNTYYSFPSEADYDGAKTTVFDANCDPIADVPQTFHDAVCVQGSGRLASAQTISFAKRDCACASVCPRSDQRICYEALSRSHFPWGRGALGRPITPFRTVAVDDSVIPLNTVVFVPAYVGLPVSDGTVHDGCFVAEDRGSGVVGQSVDVFVGSEADLQTWNRLVPTGSGVEVFVDADRCDALVAERQ